MTVPKIKTSSGWVDLQQVGPQGPKGDRGSPGEASVPIEPWRVVGAAGQPAFQSGWANYGAAGYGTCAFRKRPDGVVEVRGLPTGGTSAQPIFTLPVGYRPPAELIFESNTNTGAARVDVNPNGSVMPFIGGAGTFLALDVIRFSVDEVTAFPTGPAGPQGARGLQGQPGTPLPDMLIARANGATSSGSAQGYYLCIEGGNVLVNGAAVSTNRLLPFSFNRAKAYADAPAGKKPVIVYKRWVSINGTGAQNVVTMGATTLASSGAAGTKNWAIGTGQGAAADLGLGPTPINTMTAPVETIGDLAAWTGFDGVLGFYLYKNTPGAAGHIRDDFIEAWLRYVDA